MKTPPPAAPAAGPPTWPPSAPPSSRPSKTPATCTSPKAGATTPPQPKPSTFTASIKTETDIHGTRRSPADGSRRVNSYYRCDGDVMNPSRCRNMVRADRLEGTVNRWFATEEFSAADYCERTVI